MSEAHSCYDCKQAIIGDVTWLAEDYRDEGGSLEGPHPFHAKCAAQPWPLYELTTREAELWLEHGKDARSLALAERALALEDK